MTLIGRGQVTSGSGCRGTLRVIGGVADVLRLLQGDPGAAVLLMTSASATAATPLFPRIRGVICTTGAATSHLAIIAREFDLPCVMGCRIERPEQFEGRTVMVDAEGAVFFDP